MPRWLDELKSEDLHPQQSNKATSQAYSRNRARQEAKETEYSLAFVIKVQNRANLLKLGTPATEWGDQNRESVSRWQCEGWDAVTQRQRQSDRDTVTQNKRQSRDSQSDRATEQASEERLEEVATREGESRLRSLGEEIKRMRYK